MNFKNILSLVIIASGFLESIASSPAIRRPRYDLFAHNCCYPDLSIIEHASTYGGIIVESCNKYKRAPTAWTLCLECKLWCCIEHSKHQGLKARHKAICPHKKYT